MEGSYPMNGEYISAWFLHYGFEMKHTSRLGLVVMAASFTLSIIGCGSENNSPRVITLWHQMTSAEREVLDDVLTRYQREHRNIKVNLLYKETEDLRSGFQAAALAGSGPDLVYGPSDAVGAFAPMGIVQDMRPFFNDDQLDQFTAEALIYGSTETGDGNGSLLQVGDRIGNHLALIINRNITAAIPKTTDELIAIAKTNTVIDGNTKEKQYGLVFNFVEPFFIIPFITGHGGWVFADSSEELTPALDTEQVIESLRFVRDLQQTHHVLPAGCDYEMADSLFKSGRAAMIINGDWSWSDYLNNSTIDAIVVPLPVVSSTGKPMAPMVAPRGYSLNVNADTEQTMAAMELVRYLTSTEVQLTFMEKLKTLPSRNKLLSLAETSSDPTLQASAAQRQNGRPMPVNAELRGVWEAMRPHYQALLGGSITPEKAATMMQSDAKTNIERMNAKLTPGPIVWVLQGFAILLAASFLWWQRYNFKTFLGDLKTNRFAYLLIAPAMLVLVLTIIYPFLYNVVLSFSNMSLRQFREWNVTGLHNYQEVFTEPVFFIVLLKTILWTAVCVAFSVAIGLMLAVALNGPVKAKAFYQLILILPWAIPAYITALTWRGMFDYEYGALNLIGNGILGVPMVNWLGEPTAAFIACIITNIWLGFPFMMIIALGGMQGIPRDLYEAARIDRVSRWGQFKHITLPMLKPVLIPAITLGTIWTFNNLNVIWLVSGGGQPSDKTHILVSYVYKAVFNLYRYGYGAALSMVIFLMLLAFSLYFLKRTNAADAVA